MLHERQRHFDAFFASLEPEHRQLFIDDAMSSYYSLQGERRESRYAERPVSFTDCLENAWDMWRDLGDQNQALWSTENDKRIHLIMRDNARCIQERRLFDAS